MKSKFKKIAAFLTGVLMLVPASSGFAAGESFDAEAASQVLAFPGAVGGGRYATGGRGGEVVHVTNLNDSGEGSFREAVSKSNRIVVFDVSGTIELKSNILVSSNVTIAGQTAPGGSGITLKNYKMGMSGDNIICRFVSSRPGPYMATTSGNDAWGGAKGSNSIIDHCSMSWTTDEQWGLYSNNEYYTVQYSIIGPADSWGGHSKGIHGFGLMMGKGFSTFDHNLIIHNVSRNFRGKVVGTETADFTNNVIYNWAYQTAYGTIGHLNYVGNTLKMGNGTTGGKHYVSVDSSTSPENFSIYLTGNRMLNRDDSVYPDVTYNNWAGITFKDGLGKDISNTKSDSSFQTIVNGVNVSTAETAESAEASYNHVIEFAGNGISSSQRTAVDQQCAYEVKTGTGNMSGTAAYDDADSAQKEKLDAYKIQCGVSYEYPSAVLTKTIVDSDNDGMPDEWELARGLNPNDASDTNGDYCGQGYTNIEYYINDLTVNAFPEGTVTPSPEQNFPARSAFDRIEAESFDEQYGIKTEECSEGGENIGYVENGDYIMFRSIDFEDGARSFNARIAGSGNNPAIELYLDSPEGTPAASLKVSSSSGGWQEWTDAVFNIPAITGKHNLYLKFTGGEGFLLNLNYFTFGKSAVPINGELIKELTVFDSDNCSAWGIHTVTGADSLLFGDRDFTYAQLPEELIGAEAIVTACDSKYCESDLAEFTAGADITVYAAFDTRVEPLPAWVADWEKTNLSFTSTNDVIFTLYKKDFSKSEKITLGTNGQSVLCVNYTVLAVPSASQPENIIGDVDADGKAGVSDAVIIQQHILRRNALTPEQTERADINSDGNVDIFDMILIRRILAGNA